MLLCYASMMWWPAEPASLLPHVYTWGGGDCCYFRILRSSAQRFCNQATATFIKTITAADAKANY